MTSCKCGCGAEANYCGWIIGHWNRGKKHPRSIKYCQKMSDVKSKNPTRLFGTKNPNYRKQRTIETKLKISKSRIGKYALDKHPRWKGGRSFLPYCPKFNQTLKKAILQRDNCQCQNPNCLTTQLESLIIYGCSLHVHHIHHDKENCYPDLIALCHSCNSKANGNEKFYENLYMNILNDRGLLFWIRKE